MRSFQKVSGAGIREGSSASFNHHRVTKKFQYGAVLGSLKKDSKKRCIKRMGGRPDSGPDCLNSNLTHVFLLLYQP